MHLVADLSADLTYLGVARAIPDLAGWRHAALGDAGSTNDLALAAARAGDPGQLWITAQRQLQGRGRRGRVWVSEPGNLYASALIILEDVPPAALGTLPLVAGLAVHEAVARAAPQLAHRLSLKWPNDLLLGDAKLAGILLEGAAAPGAKRAVVIGCGINLRHAPAGTPYPATTLAAAGVHLEAATLFPVLASSLAGKLAPWGNGTGARDVAQAWRAVATGLGQPIRVNLPDRSLQGLFADIDADGYLLLETRDAGMMRIAAGDVFLLT